MPQNPPQTAPGQGRPPLIPTEAECKLRIFGSEHSTGYLPLMLRLVDGEPTATEIEEAECLVQLMARELRRWRSAIALRDHQRVVMDDLGAQKGACVFVLQGPGQIERLVEAFRAGKAGVR